MDYALRWRLLTSAATRRKCAWPVALFLMSLTAAGSDWTFNADFALKETFDSNVYLQDATPNPAITNAAQPKQHSMVTSVTPKAGFTFKPCSGFNVSGFGQGV